jgi:hypothetical protein
MSAHGSTLRICGVDGCPGGWIVADGTGCRVVHDLAELVPAYDVIGIDMPIGLADDGTRACDVGARKALFHRASTVFSAPPRSLLAITDYPTANARSREVFGRGISKQSFMIWDKIRELDVQARLHPDRFVEIHPECSFAAMAGEPLPTKHSDPGKNFRKNFLEKHFGTLPDVPAGARVADLLDSYAVLWSARRFAADHHITYGDGALDSVGLAMRIVA